jgi:hypothetical protein
VSAVIASLIAVGGILLGGFSTYWFQLRAAKQTGVTARQERLRQDQLVACSEFAAAVTDLRRALIAVWFRQGRKNRAVADRAQAVDAIDSAVDKAAVEALDMDFEAHMSTFVATAAKTIALGLVDHLETSAALARSARTS